MSEIRAVMEWTFFREAQPPDDVQQMLVEGEHLIAAYKTVRDVATITNKRIMIADRQGITGNKMEVYTIPFKSIVMYSSENAGAMLDFNAELELWTLAGHFRLKLKKGVDIRKLDRIIAHHIL
ncbi:MAG: PH domain-containing protein [Anaerolineales bacterium]|nr:PH domain-containing protein [Anaerolineales bacterium]